MNNVKYINWFIPLLPFKSESQTMQVNKYSNTFIEIADFLVDGVELFIVCIFLYELRKIIKLKGIHKESRYIHTQYMFACVATIGFIVSFSGQRFQRQIPRRK